MRADRDHNRKLEQKRRKGMVIREIDKLRTIGKNKEITLGQQVLTLMRWGVGDDLRLCVKIDGDGDQLIIYKEKIATAEIKKEGKSER